MPPLPATAGFVLTLGKVICGIGMAAAGFGPSFGAISRQTPPKKRSVALGVVTAGGSIGQFAIVPFASLVQHRLDNWHIKKSIWRWYRRQWRRPPWDCANRARPQAAA